MQVSYFLLLSIASVTLWFCVWEAVSNFVPAISCGCSEWPLEGGPATWCFRQMINCSHLWLQLFPYTEDHSRNKDFWVPWKNVSLKLTAFILLVHKVYLKWIWSQEWWFKISSSGQLNVLVLCRLIKMCSPGGEMKLHLAEDQEEVALMCFWKTQSRTQLQ